MYQSKLGNQEIDHLFEAILTLETLEDCYRFFEDLCTIHELQSLAQRCQKEGPAFLAGTQIWVCSVCGFVFVGEAPPELCPVCKVPAWKFDRIEGRTSA